MKQAPDKKEVLCTQLMKLGFEYRVEKSWGRMELKGLGQSYDIVGITFLAN